MGRPASGAAVADAAAPGRRLQGDERRAALLDAAASLLARDGLGAVSMETVAAVAGVSRPLVYKHFANRHELLAEVFRVQASKLDAAIVAAVEAADGFEGKIRALIRAVLEAERAYGPVMVPLLRARLDDAQFQHEQRGRDRRTVSFFGRLAMEAFGLERSDAIAAMSVLLTGIESVRAQARARPSEARRLVLEDLYVDLVTGALTRLGARGPARRERAPTPRRIDGR